MTMDLDKSESTEQLHTTCSQPLRTHKLNHIVTPWHLVVNFEFITILKLPIIICPWEKKKKKVETTTHAVPLYVCVLNLHEGIFFMQHLLILKRRESKG